MSNQTQSGGIGFCGLLAIVLIALKLTGLIVMSWLWVLSPLWIPVALVFGVGAVVLLFAFIAAAIKERWFQKYRNQRR